MTLAPLTFDFPLTAPPVEREGKPPLILSHRMPWAVDVADQCAELLREYHQREAVYPKFVAEGRMKPAEADHHLDLLDQIHRDITEGAPIASPDAAPAPPRWDAKVRELRRELAMRRNLWPQRIASGRLREIDAIPHMEALEAVHFRYWIRLEFWDEVAPATDAQVAALCPAGCTSSLYHQHRACHSPFPGGPCPGWEAASAPRHAIRARSAAVDAWLWQSHLAGTLTGYLTPEQIAWHEGQQHKEAA